MRTWLAGAAAPHTDENGVRMVVLAERDDSAEVPRLEIQRGPKFDDETYCLVDERCWTHYGGVTSWRVSDGHLVIELDGAATAEFGFPGWDIEIDAGAGMTPDELRVELADLLEER